MSLATELQKLHQDSPLIELFSIDATSLGGTTYHFTPHFAESSSITYNGITYSSIPIITNGWEISSSGSAPRPTLSISNINHVLFSAVVSLGDLVGAKVVRLITFEKFLDGKPGADTNQYYGPDRFVIDQKTTMNANQISFTLTSEIDKFGIQLPKQQFTKDVYPGIGRQRGTW